MSDSLNRESEEAKRTLAEPHFSEFTERSHRSARPSEIWNLRSQVAGEKPQMPQSYTEEKLPNEPIRSARSSRFQVHTSRFSEIAKRSHLGEIGTQSTEMPHPARLATESRNEPTLQDFNSESEVRLSREGNGHRATLRQITKRTQPTGSGQKETGHGRNAE
jgi:hypothetical protein